MLSLDELRHAIRERRAALKLGQAEVARRAGVSRETISLLERGHLPELGFRKVLAVLAALELDLKVTERGARETLDDLRLERSRTR